MPRHYSLEAYAVKTGAKDDPKMYFLTIGALCLVLARVNALTQVGDLTQLPCPYLYEFVEGNCYRVVKEAKTQADAQTNCEKTGGTLASPNSEKEFAAIIKLIKSDPSANPAAFWLGYTDKDHEGMFLNLNDKVFTHNLRFKPGEPNNCCGGEHCLEVYRNDGRMNDRACSSKVASVCSACPQGSIECGMETPDEYNYLYESSDIDLSRIEFSVKARNDAHIGLSLQPADDTDMYEIVIGGWRNSQSVIRRCKQCPNLSVYKEDGIVSGEKFRGFWISYDVRTGYLAVGKEGDQAPFMTWVDPDPIPVKYVGFSTGWGSTGTFRYPCAGGDEEQCPCPALWTEHGGNCYRFFGQPRTSQEAEDKCESFKNSFSESAHLTSIHSQKENDFLTSFIGKSVPGDDLTRTWIGFNDKAKEGAFKWSDGSTNNYRKWESGEPNNSGGKEDCTHTNHKGAGLWNDTPCSSKRPAVCKMPVNDHNDPCYQLAEAIEHLIGKCEAKHP